MTRNFTGLFIEPIANDSLIHTLLWHNKVLDQWSSYKSHCTVESIGATEVLAEAKAIENGKDLKHTCYVIFEMRVYSVVVLESHKLLTILSTLCNLVISL